MSLYENIRKRRKEMRMSQVELARKLGYADHSAIAHIEKGDIDLPQSKIIAIAKALDTTPGDLMGDVITRVDLIAAKMERLTDSQLDIIQMLVDDFIGGDGK